MEPIRKSFEVRWSDLDLNGHLRHSAYADYATDARLAHFMRHGMGPGRFLELGVSPVILREELRYLREISGSDPVEVDFRVAAMAPDGSRWRARHAFEIGAERKLAAIVTVDGGWFHLATRRLVPPPPEITTIFDLVPRTEDFEALPDLRRPG